MTSDFIFWYHHNLVGDTVNHSTYVLFAFGTNTRTSPSLHCQTMLLGHTNILKAQTRIRPAVKLVLSCHSKIVKTKIFMTNDS